MWLRCHPEPHPFRARGVRSPDDRAPMGEGVRRRRLALIPFTPLSSAESPSPRGGEGVKCASAQAAAAVGAMATRTVSPMPANPVRTSSARPCSPPNKCATPLMSSLRPSVPSTSTSGDQRSAQRASRCTSAESPSGSAGMAIVLTQAAAVFVDGRYTLQAAKQVDAKAWSVEPLIDPSPESWLAKHLGAGDRLGF